MKKRLVNPNHLIPTDCPRTLMGILKFIPMLIYDVEIEPIVIVPRAKAGSGNKRKYFVCSGNHRAAAAFICQCKISAVIVSKPEDLEKICEGKVARCKSVIDLESSCREEASSGLYLAGGWEEYLRMITDSGVVNYEESDGINMSDLDLKRKSW